MPCWISSATSGPSIVSRSSSASATSSSPRRCVRASRGPGSPAAVQDAGDLLVEELRRVVGVLPLRRHQVLAEEHRLAGCSTPSGRPARDMPHSRTMRRAMPVACSRSFAAPELRWPNTIISATRPPIALQIVSSKNSLEYVWRSWGRRPRDAEGHAAGQDRHLVQRVAVGQHRGQQGVAALVVGGRPLLLGRQDHRLACGAEHHPVAGVLEVDPLDLLASRGARRRVRPR